MTKRINYQLKIGDRLIGEFEFYDEASAVWDQMGRPVASIIRLHATKRRRS